MPRTSKIAHVSERDTDAFRMLWSVQHVPRELLDITNNRLHTYVSSGLVERVRTVDNQELIRCTPKGRDYISKQPEFWGRKPYSSSYAPTHNSQLAAVYASLTKEQQEHWRTEKEVAELYNEQMERLYEHEHDRWAELVGREWSPCDAAIVNDAGEVEMLIEVITDNYNELDTKLVCSQVLNAEVTFYKA